VWNDDQHIEAKTWFHYLDFKCSIILNIATEVDHCSLFQLKGTAVHKLQSPCPKDVPNHISMHSD